MAVDHLEEYMDVFGPQLEELGQGMLRTREIPIAVAQEDLPFHALNVLRLEWTWGGAECVAALARTLRRPINVYLEEGGVVPFNPPDDMLRANAIPINIMHRMNPKKGNPGERTHYESIISVLPIQVSGLHLSCDCICDCPFGSIGV